MDNTVDTVMVAVKVLIWLLKQCILTCETCIQVSLIPELISFDIRDGACPEKCYIF